MLYFFFTGCSILGFNITLPTIANAKVAKHVYYSIESDCMRLDACADISLSLAGISYTKALKAFVDLDPCSFVLKVGFESYQLTKVLLNYDWGKETLPVWGLIQKEPVAVWIINLCANCQFTFWPLIGFLTFVSMVPTQLNALYH